MKYLLLKLKVFFLSLFGKARENDKIALKAIECDECDKDKEDVVHRERKRNYDPETFKKRLKEYYAIWGPFEEG